MSGTSLDSVDSCLVRIYDDMSFEVIDSYSLEYPDSVREKLLLLANNKGDVKEVCFMNFVVGELFAQAANILIQKSGIKKEDVDFISSHGQTICHIPQISQIGGIKTRSTLQIGDISVISQKTGLMTIGDYRTKDIAANGHGAPLVPFADKIIFGTDKNRVIQNIGGISNSTVLSKNCEIFAFDNGPGNMIIDYFMNKLFSQPYDKNGETAAMGTVDINWLNSLLKEPYYLLEPPKTTGRELFNEEYAKKIYETAPKDKYDVIATVTNLTARVIADSYKAFILPKTQIEEAVLCGGGAYNKTLRQYLNEYLPDVKITTCENYNINNKLKECISFAFLGYYTFIKKPNNVPSCTGADSPVIMGKISF